MPLATINESGVTPTDTGTRENPVISPTPAVSRTFCTASSGIGNRPSPGLDST